ncbi:MAG TPA: hypothetical protein VMY76_12315 [Gemmatimonadales bacterium]|nr:hypothetical protein [Gemmatimonadales bacterium]
MPPARRTALQLWIDPTPRPGWLNMAIDSALLERAERGERWLRLYAWEPCLSFGRHEPARRRYDADRIAFLGLCVVRRPTGGRAVWHSRELTYAVTAPSNGFGSLRAAHTTIHLVLLDALRALGAAAELAPARAAVPVDGGACFAAPSGGELVVAGRKVVGSAQLRSTGALLQHGSLLLHDDQRMVGAVTLGGAPPDGSAPLSRILGRPVEWGEAARAVVEAADRTWGVADAARTSGMVVDRALALADRYRSAAWTWSGTTSR